MTNLPILVMMSYRGGVRLERCLKSIATSQEFFSRIILSITASEESDDMRMALAFQAEYPNVEVLCTGIELPTMQHQAFWVSYLERTGANPKDWIYWLAYDDEVRATGIREILDQNGNWPLHDGSAYFGPWAMRHESAEAIWNGNLGEDLECWTSFPAEGPLCMPVLRWIDDQLRQPTYMQMSGSIAQFSSYLDLRDGRPKKGGPMRIEMSIAASRHNLRVEEFHSPIAIIYGRSNSDRSNYSQVARREDIHIGLWMARYVLAHPSQVLRFVALAQKMLSSMIWSRFRPRRAKAEEWRVRGSVPSD